MNILFLIYNRPAYTFKVFEKIREAKPQKLFIAADGPKPDKKGDAEKCLEARKIVERIDWPCEVKTLFREKNLGCKIAVSGGISWFFEQVEEGIILEDDCLPNQSFFSFADLMLEKYRNNSKIMHVGGTNFQSGEERGSDSYHFSHCVHIWGWASWRRAWQTYDLEMRDLDSFISSKKIDDFFSDKRASKFWISLFRHIKNKNVDTWDTQWAFALMKSDGLAITPNVNLVENLDDKKLHRPTSKLDQIKDPLLIETDKEADTQLTETLYIKSPWQRLWSAFISLIN